jgi:hypothetical protein
MTLLDDVRLLLQAPTMNASDVRTLLRQDHDELIQLARDMYESESGDGRRALLKRLKPALIHHSRAEEKEVYEPLLEVRDSEESRDIANEGLVEHGLLDELLERLLRSRKTESDEWKAHAKVLLELIEHHVEQEHKHMFEELGEHFTDEDREEMGRRFVAAKTRMAMLKVKAA